MKKTTIDETNIHKYYNVDISGNFYTTDGNKVTNRFAKFREFRSEPILDNQQDYHATLVRASLPLSTLPINIFPVQLDSGLLGPAGANRGLWSITFDNGVSTFQERVIFIPENERESVPPSPEDNYNTQVALKVSDPVTYASLIPARFQSKSEYYFVYSYKWLVYLLNNTLSTLHTNIGGVGQPPYCEYNDNGTFSLIFPVEYDPSNIAYNGYNVYINDELKTTWLGAFTWVFEALQGPDGKDWRLFFNEASMKPYFRQEISTTAPTTPEFWRFEQEYVYSPQYLSAVNKILVTSFSINGRPELIQRSEKGFQGSDNQNFPIIFSFKPDETFAGTDTAILNYYSTNFEANNVIDLRGFQALFSVDIEVYWQDKDLRIYLLQLGYNQVLSLKFLFTRKDKQRQYFLN